MPAFPYAEGWLGGDAAYSVPLRDGRSVWLFGDTFIGAGDQQTRKNSRLIHNSIAVSDCDDQGQWSIDYAWGKQVDGSPGAFIPDESEDRYWWLFDGFEFENNFYIGLLKVEAAEPRGALNLGFRNTAMKLARVANYHEDPGDWRFDVLPLSDNRVAFPGSAMVVHGEYLYLFAFLDRNATDRPRMLSRVPLSALEHGRPGDSIEYFAQNHEWRSGFEPEAAAIVMSDNATEMSVRFHPGLERWLAVYNRVDADESPSEGLPTGTVLLRTASRLEGPWSQPTALFRPSELEDVIASSRDSNLFCYAAKEHPQFVADDELTITYVCNLLTREGEDPWAVLSRLAIRMDLYRPRVIRVPMPPLIFD